MNLIPAYINAAHLKTKYEIYMGRCPKTAELVLQRPDKSRDANSRIAKRPCSCSSSWQVTVIVAVLPCRSKKSSVLRKNDGRSLVLGQGRVRLVTSNCRVSFPWGRAVMALWLFGPNTRLWDLGGWDDKRVGWRGGGEGLSSGVLAGRVHAWFGKKAAFWGDVALVMATRSDTALFSLMDVRLSPGPPNHKQSDVFAPLFGRRMLATVQVWMLLMYH